MTEQESPFYKVEVRFPAWDEEANKILLGMEDHFVRLREDRLGKMNPDDGIVDAEFEEPADGGDSHTRYEHGLLDVIGNLVAYAKGTLEADNRMIERLIDWLEDRIARDNWEAPSDTNVLVVICEDKIKTLAVSAMIAARYKLSEVE